MGTQAAAAVRWIFISVQADAYLKGVALGVLRITFFSSVDIGKIHPMTVQGFGDGI